MPPPDDDNDLFETPAPAKPRAPLSSAYDKFQPADANWSLDRLGEVKDYYRASNSRELPLKNIGQGSIHNKLGFDHRSSADVSINPTTPEGTKLREFLKSKNIPYLAFDRAVPGVATGPHIHVGLPSHRTSAKFGIGAQKKNGVAADSDLFGDSAQTPAADDDSDLFNAPATTPARPQQQQRPPAQPTGEVGVGAPTVSTGATDAYGRAVPASTGAIRKIVGGMTGDPRAAAITKNVIAARHPTTTRGRLEQAMSRVPAGSALGIYNAAQNAFTPEAESVGTEVNRRLDQQAFADEHAPELAAKVAEYRTELKHFGKNQVNKWLNEMSFYTQAQLAGNVAGALRPIAPGASAKMRIISMASAQAAEEKGADRNAISNFAQKTAGGFIASTPELVAMAAGVPAPVAFGLGGGLSAAGSGGDLAEIAKGAGVGAATGALFDVPVPGVSRVGRALQRAGVVGVGTTAIEAATGQPIASAAVSGATNALMAGAPELAGAHSYRELARPREPGEIRAGSTEVPTAITADAERVATAAHTAAINAGVSPEAADRATAATAITPYARPTPTAPISRALYVPAVQANGQVQMIVPDADGSLTRKTFDSQSAADEYVAQRTGFPGASVDTAVEPLPAAALAAAKSRFVDTAATPETAELPAEGERRGEHRPKESDWLDMSAEERQDIIDRTAAGFEEVPLRQTYANRDRGVVPVDVHYPRNPVEEAAAQGKKVGQLPSQRKQRGSIGEPPDEGPKYGKSGAVEDREAEQEADRSRWLGTVPGAAQDLGNVETPHPSTAAPTSRMQDAFNARDAYSNSLQSTGREPRNIDPLRQAVTAIHADFHDQPQSAIADWIRRNRPDLLADYTDHEIAQAVRREFAERADAKLFGGSDIQDLGDVDETPLRFQEKYRKQRGSIGERAEPGPTIPGVKVGAVEDRERKVFKVARPVTEAAPAAPAPTAPSTETPDAELSADARTSAQRYHAWKSASMEDVQSRLGLNVYDDWEAARDKVIAKHAGAFAGQSNAEDYASAVDRLDKLTPDALAKLPEPPVQNAPANASLAPTKQPRVRKPAAEKVEHPTDASLSGTKVGESASGKTVYVQNAAGEVHAPRRSTLNQTLNQSPAPHLRPLPGIPGLPIGRVRLTDIPEADRASVKSQMLRLGQDPHAPFEIKHFQVDIGPGRSVQMMMSRQGHTALVANIATPEGQHTTPAEFRTAMRSYLDAYPEVQRIAGERLTGLTQGKDLDFTRVQLEGDRTNDLRTIQDTLKRAHTKVHNEYSALQTHMVRRNGLELSNDAAVRNYYSQLRKFVRTNMSDKLQLVTDSENAYAAGQYGRATVLAEQSFTGIHDYMTQIAGAYTAVGAMIKFPNYTPPGGNRWRLALDEARRRLGEVGPVLTGGSSKYNPSEFPKGGYADHAKVAYLMEPFVDAAKAQFADLVRAGKLKANEFARYARELIQTTFETDPDFRKWHKLNRDSAYGAVMGAARGQQYDAAVNGFRTVADPASKYVDDAPLNFAIGATDRSTTRDIRREVTGDQNQQLAIGNTLAHQGRKAIPDALGQSAIYFYNAVGGDTAKLRSYFTNADKRLDSYRPAIQRAMNLSPAELTWASTMREAYDALGDYSRSLGTINHVRDNYTNKLYVAEKPDKNFVQTDAFRSGLSKRTSHSKPIVYANALDAVLGIDTAGNINPKGKKLASTSAFDNYQVLNSEMARANTNAKFREAMMRVGLGSEVSSSKIPEGYTALEGMGRDIPIATHEALTSPGGKGFKWNQPEEEGAMTLHKSFVVPDGIAKGLAALTDADFIRKVGWLRKTLEAQAVVKTIKLSYSAFHDLALASQFLYQTKFVGGLPALRKWANDGALNELERDFTRHTGMTTRVESNADIINKLSDSDSLLARAAKLPVVKQAVKLSNLHTDFLFDGLQRKLKLIDYGMKTAGWLKDHPTPTARELIEAKRSIASEINAAYGGLNWKALGVSRSNLSILRLALLAPDWTLSNGILLQKAIVGKTLQGPGGTAARSHILTAAIGGALLTEGLSYAFHGRSSTQNERGHETELEVAPGVYVSLFRGGISDVVKMIQLVHDIGPIRGSLQFAGNKQAPIPRSVVGAISNVATGRPIYVPYNPSESWITNTVNQLKQSGQIIDPVLPAPIGTTNLVRYATSGKVTPIGAAAVATGLGRATTDRGARTPAEKHIAALEDRKGHDIYDDAHTEHYHERREFIESIRTSGVAAVAPKVRALAQAGKLGPQDVEAIRDASKLTPFQEKFKRLNDLNDALDTWALMSPNEQKSTRAILGRKLQNVRTKSAEEKQQILNKMRKLGLAPTEPVSANRPPARRAGQDDLSYRASLKQHLHPSAAANRLSNLLNTI